VSGVAVRWRQRLDIAWSTARAWPEIGPLWAFAVAATLWAMGAGTLPGAVILEHLTWPGALLVVSLGSLAFAVAGRRCFATADGPGPRSLLRRLALLQLLVAAASPLPALVGRDGLADAAHTELLSLVLCAGVALALLLPVEAVDLWRRSARHPRATVARSLVLLLLSAIALVCGVETAVFVRVGTLDCNGCHMRWGALLGNVALLASALVGLFALTGRILLAVLLGAAAYAGFAAAQLAKMEFMHAAIQPLELQYLPEFLPQFESTFGFAPARALALAVVAGAVVAWLSRRAPPSGVSGATRVAAGLASAIVALAVGVGHATTPGAELAGRLGIAIADWDSMRSARQNGLLLEFALHLPDLWITPPPGYSASAIEDVVRRRDAFAATSGDAAAAPGEPIGLIVYMIESFVDPADLGLRFSSDPIPTFRALSAVHTSGSAIVPGAFGRSANSEFEILTGMSMTFLPPASTPYKQYLKRRIPSLPCSLRERGYATVAVHADPMHFFNRPQVQPLLCFDQSKWLHEDPDAARDVRGFWASDEAVVDAILRAIDELPPDRPFFVFGFPSSTHHPYEQDGYADSQLDLVDPEPGLSRREVKFYVNALRAADRALERLVQHVERIDRKTLVVVLGDHVPPLSERALLHFYDGADGDSLEVVRRQHRVPLLIWSNFPRTRKHVELSLNALTPHLLRALGIRPTGFLGFVDEFHRRIPVFSRLREDRDGARWGPGADPARYQAWVDDYALLQYDLLLGAQHSIRAASEREPSRRSR
jgi:hypothetical protein